MSKKKKGKEKAEKQKNRKKTGSFVLKLTFRQMMRLVFTMLLIDVLLAALFIGTVLARAEQTVDRVAELSVEEALDQVSVLNPDISVTLINYEPSTLKLPAHVEIELERFTDELRMRSVSRESWFLSLLNDEYPDIQYSVYIPAELPGEYLEIAFDLGPTFFIFRRTMMILLAAEGAILFFSLFGVRRSVKRTLAPLHQLTMAARNITTEPPGPVPARPEQVREELELSGTIHTLNSITAKRLDTRIIIDDERDELRGLAGAINSMLDRLDAAYQSQLRFVSDASHELRTPIAVIQGYANLLDRWGKENPETLQESIDAIKLETSSMQALVEQLLFLARSDNNSIVMNLDTFDISGLASELLRDARVIDQGHELISDIDTGLWIVGDSGLLKQALRIFLDNAIKYTPSGERIKVTAKREGEEIQVSVSDNGIGIPEEDLPYVFERFYRSDESRARKTGGTGLGLAIAKWTVQRHGGHLDIVSRKDIGTRLTMALPVAQPKTEELPQAQ